MEKKIKDYYSKFEDIVVGQTITRDLAENMPITWGILGGFKSG